MIIYYSEKITVIDAEKLGEVKEMNELHEKLLYVKSLVTAMGKLNEEEAGLQRKKRTPANVQPIVINKSRQGGSGQRAILVVVFVFLFLFNVVPVAMNRYDAAKEQIEIDKANDEFAWMMEHNGEEYPGYQGSETVSMVSVLLPAVIRGVVVAFVFTGVIAAISAARRKRQDAMIEENNRKLQNNYEATLKNNEIILRNNAEIDEQIQQIANRRVLISEEYMQNIIEWYPKDYGYPAAVDFFINQVENHLATTIQECVEQYNTYTFRQKVTDNQKIMIGNQQIMISKQDEMIRQQMIGNAIATVNMMANVATAHNTANIAHNTADIAYHTQNISENSTHISNRL